MIVLANDSYYWVELSWLVVLVWVGLTHGLGRFQFSAGLLGWVHYSKSTKNLKELFC